MPSLLSKLPDPESVNLRNTRHRQYFNIPQPLTNYERRTFKYNATLVLPTLNKPVLESINVKFFGRKLKRYLLEKQCENAITNNIILEECSCDYSSIDDVVNCVYTTTT